MVLLNPKFVNKQQEQDETAQPGDNLQVEENEMGGATTQPDDQFAGDAEEGGEAYPEQTNQTQGVAQEAAAVEQ